MPAPTASVADQVLHVILSRIAVESPDSGQPELHAGRYSAVPLMSWAWARKVLAPVAEAVTLDEVDGLAGTEAGPLGDADPAADAAELADVAGALAGLEAGAAELLDELQAVTSKAAQASAAHPPACRALRVFVVNMNFHPSPSDFLSGSLSRLTHTTSAASPWLGPALRGAVTPARSALILRAAPAAAF
jgi:hypothetical protein